MSQDELISIGDAARQLGVSVETIRRWEHAGKIIGTRTPGNQRRFAKTEVDRIASGAVA